MNFGSKAVDLNITVTGLESGIKSSGSKKTVLTSTAPLDENSFEQPEKVTPHHHTELVMVVNCSL